MATKKKKKTAKKPATHKKASTKKATAKKATTKKSTNKKKKTVKKVKKAATKKKVAKKAATKKKVAKKAAIKKKVAKKAKAKKATAKKSAPKKSTHKKAIAKTAKKVATKKKVTPKSSAKKPAETTKNTKAKKISPKSRLNVGDFAPIFALQADTGETINLEQFRGQKNIVLYFYPKDDTPGCTIEACNFRDDLHEITDLDAVVLGVSADDLDSHAKFRNKFSLNFPLLADLGAEVAQAYGAYGEKNMYGKKYLGVMRSTFVIDKEGRIAATWPKVKVEEHSKEVQEVLRGLAS